jgi:Arc/MetJ-type ribon-helix-helix transcriptional regulator
VKIELELHDAAARWVALGISAGRFANPADAVRYAIAFTMRTMALADAADDANAARAAAAERGDFLNR